MSFPSALDLTGISNASALRFAHEQSAELVGYLSGLIPPRRGTSDQRMDTIAYLGGRDTAAARLAAAGLERGLRRARRGGAVLVGFSDELNDRTACEALANDQIDQGADHRRRRRGQLRPRSARRRPDPRRVGGR